MSARHSTAHFLEYAFGAPVRSKLIRLTGSATTARNVSIRTSARLRLSFESAFAGPPQLRPPFSKAAATPLRLSFESPISLASPTVVDFVSPLRDQVLPLRLPFESAISLTPPTANGFASPLSVTCHWICPTSHAVTERVIARFRLPRDDAGSPASPLL
ncbi:hypothetical protein FPANT_14079 [Fusarium pseudoanthophilum]|uniref:Uncharacterized protein n=1 Tax=Fusarium pseudoanthophilum TaxID=48495 RepID=A0A8H5K6M5_9HYPO|nr:hypothetical protein FPANT_14079 [Fusarium pseudoanthophilum]